MDNPVRLSDGDLNVAMVLAGRGLLELLPGCTNTFNTTSKGRLELQNRLPDEHGKKST